MLDLVSPLVDAVLTPGREATRLALAPSFLYLMGGMAAIADMDRAPVASVLCWFGPTLLVVGGAVASWLGGSVSALFVFDTLVVSLAAWFTVGLGFLPVLFVVIIVAADLGTAVSDIASRSTSR